MRLWDSAQKQPCSGGLIGKEGHRIEGRPFLPKATTHHYDTEVSGRRRNRLLDVSTGTTPRCLTFNMSQTKLTKRVLFAVFLVCECHHYHLLFESPTWGSS